MSSGVIDEGLFTSRVQEKTVLKGLSMKHLRQSAVGQEGGIESFAGLGFKRPAFHKSIVFLISYDPGQASLSLWAFSFLI